MIFEPDKTVRNRTDAHETALSCLSAGVRAVRPERVLQERLSLSNGVLEIDSVDEPSDSNSYELDEYDRLLVLGGGKASGRLVAGLKSFLGDRIDGGTVVTTEPVESRHVSVYKGDHPTPSDRNVAATEELLEQAATAGRRTLVLAAITGGASALLSAPVDEIPLADLRTTTEMLLESGAAIGEINAVRKHCSAIKGGQLAVSAEPATVVTLAISDVVGDDPSTIGSGPTVHDDSSYADAVTVLDRYDLEKSVPDSVTNYLEAGADGHHEETPSRDQPAFDRTDWRLLANTRTALEAARSVAHRRGYETMILSSRIRGEAREAGRFQAAIAEESRASENPLEPPAVVLSGGEVTVTVTGDGTGGPNQELAVAAGLEFHENRTEAVLTSVDSDGVDGPTDAAGAIVSRSTIDAPSEARARLEANDVYDLLAECGGLLQSGPTGTNVNDIRVLVVPRAD